MCLPWYVQMYMRHGAPFTDRLLFHDMYKRAFVHVHDTNTGDDVSFRYYVWQLGLWAISLGPASARRGCCGGCAIEPKTTTRRAK